MEIIKTDAAVPEVIGNRIHIVRGQKVMFDSDLAALYEVPTGVLNQAVKRNMNRFPKDFMFRLSAEELENWRSQFVMSNSGGGKMGLRRPPYVFTEHGVTMAATVLKSDRAVQMGIQIVRAFIRLRELVAAERDRDSRIEKIEQVQEVHGSVINLLAGEIEALKLPVPKPAKGKFGYPKAMATTGGGGA